MINCPIYTNLEKKYGYNFCHEAGYFVESKLWNDKYSNHYLLPKNSTVIQYSGAFYPFHEGHLSIIKSSIDLLANRIKSINPIILLHIDSYDYRESKGKFNELGFRKSFIKLNNLFKGEEYKYKDWTFDLIYEDRTLNPCSRNFTRLYQELCDRNNDVYFLAGGDRSNFALTFKDDGKCIIAGRNIHPNYKKYNYLENNRIFFINENFPLSSTQIREQHDT